MKTQCFIVIILKCMSGKGLFLNIKSYFKCWFIITFESKKKHTHEGAVFEPYGRVQLVI